MRQIFFVFLGLAIFLSSLTTASNACTIFRSYIDGDAQTAHNMDWYDQFPNVKGAISLNPARMHKVGTVFGAPVKTAEWTSLYKSMAFSIGGAEFPVSGFNEKGLFIAILMLPETRFPVPQDPRPAVATTQFVQYNLDVSANIDEVIASDKVVRPFSTVFKMHYFVCESSAKCAVLQYVDGNLTVYRGADLPYDVLTNSLYPASAAAAQTCDKQSCEQTNTSLWRFGQAALQRSSMAAPFVENAFGILNNVAQSKGTTTRFQLTYDPKQSRMYVRKGGQAPYAWVDADFSKLECNVVRKVIPLTAMMSGDISDSWQDLTEAMQYDLALSSGLPQPMAAEAGRYPFVATKCK